MVCSVPSHWVSLANSSRGGSCLRTCTHTLELNNKGGSNPAVRATELDSSANNFQVMLRLPLGGLWANLAVNPGQNQGGRSSTELTPYLQLWVSQKQLLRITNTQL